MRGRPGKGASIGLVVGIALAALLIGLPSVLSGDNYETVDSLVSMGLPIVVVGIALGALIGAPSVRAPGGGSADGTYQPARRGRVPLAIAASAAVLLMIAFFLTATGVVGGSLP
jgi:hypothetical protein